MNRSIHRIISVILPILCGLILLPGIICCHAQTDLNGWHVQGQTFLVWEHNIPGDTLYDIYASSQPITSLDDDRWIGRVFSDNAANFRLHEYAPEARWILPKSAGGTTTVGLNEAYFVVTPQQAGEAYYAVVASGDTLLSEGNTVGPIFETASRAGPVVQLGNDSLTVYGHWIDGRRDYDSGRPGYPVMGDQYENGLGYNFAIWEPQADVTPPELPLVVALHGGGGTLWTFAPHRAAGYYTRGLAGYLACLDDGHRSRDPLSLEEGVVNTFWYGYNTEYDRFHPEYPSDSATVVDYTARRTWWEISWLMQHYPIDSTRVSLLGASMGGNGTLLYTQFGPEPFSAALAMVPTGTGPVNVSKYKLLGLEQQNLPTNLEGQPGIYDAFNWQWRLDNLLETRAEWPFTTILSGKQDTLASWVEKPGLYHQLDSAATGFALYWDEREHTQGWFTAHFGSSEHIHAAYLTRFRHDRSYPGFSATDVDLAAPGRQPDPGDGHPQEGDPWGTWGGYLEWDPEMVEETADSWSAVLWVKSQSQYACDVPAADTILASVTPRRLQQFQPQPGQAYRWELARESNGQLLQSGNATADESGAVTVTNLLLIKDRARLTIFRSLRTEEDENDSTPRNFDLFQNHPNPFNTATTISYRLPMCAPVKLSIFNIAGQRVALLVDEVQETGLHQATFFSANLSSGLYFCHLECGQRSDIRKMVLLK